METEKKTIAITYDEACRMQDFCKDENKNISKEFYDWYLNESTFFCRSGAMVIDMKGEHISPAIEKDSTNIIDNPKNVKKHGRFTMIFNVKDSDNVLFEVYQYGSPYAICRFGFNRQENLLMNDLIFNFTYYSEINYSKSGHIMLADSFGDRMKKIEKDAAALIKQAVRGGNKTHINKAKITSETASKLKRDALNDNCMVFVYSFYALMYYVSNRGAEEITTEFKKEINSTDDKVKSTYKYTGYVDLRENKVYRPIINKDPNEPVRGYERHIQSWTVRGHYRKTKNGRIWIDPHIKGDGELEKRIYSTEDEKDLKIIPKVFDVMRPAPISNNIKVELPKASIPPREEKNVSPAKMSFIEKVKSLWRKITKQNRPRPLVKN